MNILNNLKINRIATSSDNSAFPILFISKFVKYNLE